MTGAAGAVERGPRAAVGALALAGRATRCHPARPVARTGSSA
jgi:hypothetical protein